MHVEQLTNYKCTNFLIKLYTCKHELCYRHSVIGLPRTSSLYFNCSWSFKFDLKLCSPHIQCLILYASNTRLRFVYTVFNHLRHTLQINTFTISIKSSVSRLLKKKTTINYTFEMSTPTF